MISISHFSGESANMCFECSAHPQFRIRPREGARHHAEKEKEEEEERGGRWRYAAAAGLSPLFLAAAILRARTPALTEIESQESKFNICRPSAVNRKNRDLFSAPVPSAPHAFILP